MRARYPDTEGFVERDGVKVGYEAFGSGEPALVFAPTDPLVHSRAWKAQVPYLARTSRVVTIDPRGNGRSDRPESSAGYAEFFFGELPAVRAQRAGRRAHRRRPADAGRCRARPDGPGARRGQSRHPGFRRPLRPCAAASSGP